MAVIVFHAGMPKTGSTNIQEWLAEQSDALRAQGVECMRIAQSGDGSISLIPATRQASTSAFVVGDVESRARVMKEICAALDHAARDAGTIVVSSESYEVLFNGPGRRDALAPLDALARDHVVRVAYYVRPQHVWLESAWLQWGFRHDEPPDVWIRRQQQRVDYLETLRVAREAAPNLSFEVRPFRSDLLEQGDVVRDFASAFLAVDDAVQRAGGPRWSNRGLPLEAALLLRGAPQGMFWRSIHDNKRFYPLKQIVLDWKLPETDRAERGRKLLQRYASATFEAGNQQLIDELGWKAEHFVPPVDAEPDDADAALRELNEVWNSTASDGEKLVFYRALEQLLASDAAPTAVSIPPAPRAITVPSLSARARGIARRARAAVDKPKPKAPPMPTRRNDGDPRVVDVAPDVGLGLTTRTFGAVVFDYDGDGWPDIFLGRHDAPAFLFKNENGRFRQVDSVEFPRTDRHCGAAGDLTGNGRLDLFCVVGGDSGHGPKRAPNELWLQDAAGVFANHGDQPGLADPFGRGREALLFDATGNGRLDILVGNVSPRNDGKPSPNRLFLNDGEGRFRAAPELGLDLEYSVGGAGKPGSPHGGGNWPMGRLAALDMNGDGWTDVVMCAQHPSETFLGVHMFRNQGGSSFRDVTAEVGLAGVRARDVAVADMDRDGQPDLVILDERALSIYLNDGGQFRLAHREGIDHGFRLAVADATGDGFDDVYVMRTSAQPGPDIADVLMLRNGAPLDFTRLTLPTVEGTVRDDAVYAIDYNKDGRSEFLVLHGHSLNAAPIQLIALR